MFSRKTIKAQIFWLPVFCFLIFFLLKIINPSLYEAFVQEDSFIENAQAVFYFLSALISGVTAWRFFRQGKTISAAICIAMLAAFGFICLEEISWFQRVLSIESPEFFLEHNKQDEITLHNLRPIQAVLHFLYIIVSGFCSFSCLFRDNLLSRFSRKMSESADLLIPEKFISSYFYPAFFIYLFYEFIVSPSDWQFLIWRDQEPAELLMAAGFVLLSIINWRKSLPSHRFR